MIGLSPPDVWVDEYCRAEDSQLFQPCGAELTVVELSHSQNAVWTRQHRPDEVRGDLESGFLVERRGSDADPFYRLAATRFAVFVQPRTGSQSGAPMAVVTSVKPLDGPSRTTLVRPAGVCFSPLWDEAPCDLSVLATEFEHGLQVARRRRGARDRARRAVMTVPEVHRPYTELHAAVRRHYQPLRLLLQLLEQRSELEGMVRADGVALESGPGDDGPVLWLRLRQPGGFAEGRMVSLAADGWSVRNLRVHAVEEDGTLLAVSLPGNGDVAAGASVRLEQRGRFALGRHSIALARFLEADVEGDWTHLAQLVTEPATLPVAPIAPAARYFDDRLNDEQRAAVDGALGTPHVFHVQGPPGTGKTTVITEVVRQLLARGERVLLLAPMHVAVDEVLGRVAAAPGVLALRISWDDGRVHPDLRRYLPEQASRTYLRQARRPQTSQAQRWRAEIAARADQQRTVRGCLDAMRLRRAAADALVAAQAAQAAWRAQLATATSAAHHDLVTADHALRRLDEQLPPAIAHAEALRAQRDAVPLLRRWWASVQDAFGSTTELARLTAAAREAEQYRQGLSADWSGWSARRDAAWTQLDSLRRDQSSGEPAHQAAVDARRAQLTAADGRLVPQLERAREVTGRDPDEADLRRWDERLTAEITRREQRIALEQRWLDLSGLRDGDPDTLLSQVDADLRNSANLICCTTTGINRSLGDADFDTLIVDEASRVVDSEFLIGARRARRWVLVGDEHQLPPYVESADEQHLHALTALHLTERVDRGGLEKSPTLQEAVERLGALWTEEEEIHQFRTDSVLRTAQRLRDNGSWERHYRVPFDDAWKRLRELGEEPERQLLSTMLDHLVRSLFERTTAAVPPQLRQQLRVQNRMIASIAELVRRPVYDGAYRTPIPCEVEPLRYGGTGTPVVFVDTSVHGGQARDRLVGNGFVNDLEAGVVANMCRSWESRLRASGGARVSVSVLTFYRGQAAAIRTALGGPRFRDFQLLDFRMVDAIDKIQGQESDLVFLSFGRAFLGRGGPSAHYGRWLQDLRRLNVACTRARRCLVLVGHAPTLRRLNGVPAAERFYRNLFDLLAGSAEYALVRQAK